MWLVCDLGYGLPVEARPRQEKIYAICRQIVNFLWWQQQQQQQQHDGSSSSSPQQQQQRPSAQLLIVLGKGVNRTTTARTTTTGKIHCNGDDTTKAADVERISEEADDSSSSLRETLLHRMQEIWQQQQQQSVLSCDKEESDTSTNSRQIILDFPSDIVAFTNDTLPDALQLLLLQLQQECHQPKCSSGSTVDSIDLVTTKEENSMDTLELLKMETAAEHHYDDSNPSRCGAQHEKETDTTANDNSLHVGTIHSHPPVVYLSPDAEHSINIDVAPPDIVIVGMLIDRRTIQVHRSVRRATTMDIPTARWPMEEIVIHYQENASLSLLQQQQPELPHLHPNEPLNVDCVLEGMQQWQWNYLDYCSGNRSPATFDCDATAGSMQNVKDDDVVNHATPGKTFVQAAIQAILHHQQRHPARTRHYPERGQQQTLPHATTTSREPQQETARKTETDSSTATATSAVPNDIDTQLSRVKI